MKSIFDLDGKLYYYSMKYAELLWVNILMLICCIPIITIGASITAMHKLLYRIHKGDSARLTKTFFTTFKENFRQSTAIWLIFIGFFLFIRLNYYLIRTMQHTILSVLSYVMPIILLMVSSSLVWVFVLQSRYSNTIWGTIKLSFVVWITHPLQTFIMLILLIFPFLMLIQYMQYAPLILFFGISFSGLLRAIVYSKVFDKLELETKDE